MRYVHEIVINDIGKVISGKPVILQNHLVIDVLIVPNHFAMDNVLQYGFAFWHSHPDDIGLAIRFPLLNLFWRQRVETQSVILGLGILLTTNLDPHFLQSLRRTEAGVSIAISHERVNELVVDCQSLALIIWALWSMHQVRWTIHSFIL